LKAQKSHIFKQFPHFQAGGEMPIGISSYDPSDYNKDHASRILFNKYEVISPIGKGSFSCVMRVQHLRTRQFYAMKTVNESPGKRYECFWA
jgi:hypothetical protein